MGAEVEELTRDRGASILVHGLPVQQAECLESLVKLMSDLIRTRLGIGREMVLVSINRLKPTKWVEAKVEQKYWLKGVKLADGLLLSSALNIPMIGMPSLAKLTCWTGNNHLLFYCHGFRTGILITEDMARCVREQWGELRKFMLKVSWLDDNLIKYD